MYNVSVCVSVYSLVTINVTQWRLLHTVQCLPCCLSVHCSVLCECLVCYSLMYSHCNSKPRKHFVVWCIQLVSLLKMENKVLLNCRHWYRLWHSPGCSHEGHVTWDTIKCSLLKVDQCSRGKSWLHIHGPRVSWLADYFMFVSCLILSSALNMNVAHSSKTSVGFQWAISEDRSTVINERIRCGHGSVRV